MRRLPSAALLALCALLPVLPAVPSAGKEGGRLEGTVVSRGRALEGVAVEVYLERRRSAAGAPFAVTGSDGAGKFALELPPGEYYLWAREQAPAFGPPRVAEYPGNPVEVFARRSTLLEPLEMKEAGSESAPAPPGTGIRGRAVIDGEPAADVSVMVYGGGAERLTGPDYVASVLTGPEGRFEADLAPGTYRVAARKRRDGSLAGFLRPGDYSAEFEGNPVTVREGSYLSLGRLALHPVDPGRLAAEERRRLEGTSPTRLSGTVVGPDGNPLAGQYVFAYRDQGMIGRPDMMAITGDDGTFSFDLPGGGTYYLGARSTMGGPRQPGEMAGRLDGSPDASVQVEEGGRRSGLMIMMESVW